MRHKRMLGAAAVITGTTLMLTGCLGGGGEASNEGGDSGKTVIRIASAESAEPVMEVLREAATEYEAETGTKVEVEAIPLTDIYTKVNSVVGTSSEYSAFLTGFFGHISLFQGEDRLVPVDDVIEELGGVEDFYDGQTLFPIDGDTYWIPFDYNLAFGIIRTDWLDQVGMEIPTTWDELLAVSEAFDGLGDDKSGLIMPLKADDSSNWITSQVLWANGVEIFDDDWNVIIDEGEMGERTTESLAMLQEMYQFMPDRADNASYADMIESFVGEQVGMSFYSGRIFDSIIAQDPAMLDNVEIFGFPMADGDGIAASLGYDGWGVFNTDHADETKEFTTWFYENKLVDMLATAPLHYQPAQKSIFERENYQAIPSIAEYGEEYMLPQEDLLTEAHLHSIDTDGPEPDARQGELFQSMIFPQAYQRVTLGGENPVEVTKWLGDEIRSLLE
ncbi:ABC transporter substrate-binding protein [Cryobacterium sp. Y62]|uniref:ABC transporter substrate-binding protein n=1 Tax=Cryobacterium sp. Y62 TaxID=2048284 RepID=UPI0011AFD83E|nr:ABC transporter substrate-binding protein [Cryobacterium sp. Y62]